MMKEAQRAPTGDTGTGHTNPLEQYLLLAKGAKGAAAVQLVRQTLEAPGVYVFAELLDCPNILELTTHEQHKPYYDLLELFAYGVYGDYTKKSTELPELTETMLKKLRHLTLISLATGHRSLPLSSLASELSISSTRQLEDLIIEAIYAEIIQGRLDQKNGVLEVEFTIGRDIKQEDLANIAQTLQAWCTMCDAMLASVDQVINSANATKEENNRHKKNLELEIASIKTKLKSQTSEGDDSMATESRDHDKKRSAKKMIRVSSSKFNWPKN